MTRREAAHKTLMEAAEEILAELEHRYDGAPDSNVLWMGSHITDLTDAIERTKRAQAAFEDDGDRDQRTLNRRTI